MTPISRSQWNDLTGFARTPVLPETAPRRAIRPNPIFKLRHYEAPELFVSGERRLVEMPALVPRGFAGARGVKSIPSKPSQGSPVVSRGKSAANHIPGRILLDRNVKEFLGFSMSRGIAPTHALAYTVTLEPQQA